VGLGPGRSDDQQATQRITIALSDDVLVELA
jgi:hypothetical protein